LKANSFGHKKGAFTDAREDRPGRFELANGGSLFLDEIGNLNLSLQSKLLNALQSRKVTRVWLEPIDGRRHPVGLRHEHAAGADGKRRKVPTGSVVPVSTR